jgi:hypothetical protein
MRAAFVLTTVVIALVLGIGSGISRSDLLPRVLIIGFVPAIWAVAHALERRAGRDMWHFSAPYPYRWMRERAETPLPPPNPAGTQAQESRLADGCSTLPLAA